MAAKLKSASNSFSKFDLDTIFDMHQDEPFGMHPRYMVDLLRGFTRWSVDMATGKRFEELIGCQNWLIVEVVDPVGVMLIIFVTVCTSWPYIKL